MKDLIDDRAEAGVFRVSRSLFNDAALFEEELRHVFEGGWLFLGLASQAPERHDFFTARAGRVPVLISRGQDGELRCFLNACPHKGARIAPFPTGNTKLHVCPYHSWSFDSAGICKNIKWQKSGDYADAFHEQDHNLVQIPKFGEYRGLLFGSLNEDVPSLEEHLGEARKMLDLVVDQSDRGLELVPGRVRFTYAANWKLQLENCTDQYHFTSTHPSYIRALEDRSRKNSAEAVQSSLSSSSFWKAGGDEIVAGSFAFDHGHAVAWGKMDVGPSLPLYDRADELAKRFGEARRNWMFNMRNLTVFPNMQIAENASSQLRVIHPIAHDMTEMETWCLAPIGESSAARTLRIRQYEDFFNPTGMATPDDTAVYEECQRGLSTREPSWLQGHARGSISTTAGGNSLSDSIDMLPAFSVAGSGQLADETLFRSYYRAWAERMKGALV
ncbi:aromatic ring-hydroxylating oxygenase subunit alpha [Rhizorhabdus dicambivorans]|uniref:aromatic ring-hydroxylating oxygenase subunit alpha n=1 Tax=Rhizorhabdus dicambivorans TaxID=1850238 RepID=UPI001EDEA9B1|nr:aromatic ring-hydroxylating dioxygenase subunit alpha [Rhizorhabdus dicambivorans]